MKALIGNGVTALRPEADSSFRSDVLSGLSRRPREIPPRWFYDRKGSELFERITELKEYYPTRTESELLHKYAPQIASMAGTGRVLVEFGSGSSAKTPVVLEAVGASRYVPIDISGDFLRASAADLSSRFPELPIHPVEADFSGPVALPQVADESPTLGFFPGSTIGNMSEYEAVDLLRRMGETLKPDSMLLIGLDRMKDELILVPAYDDSEGVTAEFNLNLLHRINRELCGNIPVDAFAHEIKWNARRSRIEMHLTATRDVRFTVSGQNFAMAADETIHTENSRKYRPEEADLLLRAGGWSRVAHWTDDQRYFSLVLAAYDVPQHAALRAEPASAKKTLAVSAR